MAIHKITRGILNEVIASQSHKDLDVAAHAADVTRWRNLALGLLEGAEAWGHLRTFKEQALTADTKEYALPDNFQRIGADTLYFSENRGVTFYDQSEEVDFQLGATWKDSTSSAGEPSCATIVGDELWLGPRPSTAFVAGNSTLRYWYFKCMDPGTLAQQWAAAQDSEDDATALHLPPWMLPYALRAALMFSLQREDDAAYQSMMRQFYERDLMEMRAFDVSVFTQEPVKRPLIPSRGRGRRRTGYSG